MLHQIRILMPNSVKNFIKRIIFLIRYLFSFIKYKKSYNQNIFIIGSPSHGNGGDIAIAIAQYKFLKYHFPNANIIDVAGNEYFSDFKAIKRICKSTDIITFIGGGNLGNQYMLEENIRRDVLQHFPQNKIIMFPQSIYFTNDETGEKEKELSKKIYSSHQHLTLIARDRYSFKMMENLFPRTKILHAPDIVLYLQYSKRFERKGALMCMRNDLESILSINDKKEIENKLNTIYFKVRHNDTWVDYKYNKSSRKYLLEEKLKEFSSSEIVLTDRIHGMIFATITSTPCIALSNYNHKVKGTYEWLEQFDYIKYANSLEEALKLIDEFKPHIITNPTYSNKNYMEFYQKIIDICC